MSEAKLKEDVKTLQQHEAFARFINQVFVFREQRIAEMRDKTLDQIQQISGEVAFANDILIMADWENLRKRFADRL